MQKKIIDYAKSLGFDLVRFTKAAPDPRSLKIFNTWLEKHYEADMDYMRSRVDINKILPGAKTVITLAVNYYREQEPLKKDYGRIARYAYARDYHKTINANLKKLREFIQKLAEQENLKAYVDTGPVLERSYAQQSGLGNIGKNACLITKEFGSWVFLAEIITTLDLPAEESTHFDICGSCTKCIDACPTKAIVSPGVIDSRKCISYLTIENKEDIPEEFKEILKNTKRLFGCDICQEVCPHNTARQKPAKEQTPIAGDQLDLKEILSIKSDEEFVDKFAGSPMMRAKRKGLQRNAKTLLNV